jgi:hypothetical protein
LWYHHVIAFVNGLDHNYPERVTALVPKLESEVAQRFGGTPVYALAPPGAVTAFPGGQSGSRATPPRTE